jgi:hypothetical protein
VSGRIARLIGGCRPVANRLVADLLGAAFALTEWLAAPSVSV